MQTRSGGELLPSARVCHFAALPRLQYWTLARVEGEPLGPGRDLPRRVRPPSPSVGSSIFIRMPSSCWGATRAPCGGTSRVRPQPSRRSRGAPIYVASTRSAAALVRNPRRAAAFERRRLREGGLESQHGECGPILPIRRRDRGESHPRLPPQQCPHCRRRICRRRGVNKIYQIVLTCT